MKKLVIGALLLATQFSVNANDSDVEKLLTLMDVDQSVDVIYDNMDKMLLGLKHQLNIEQSEMPLFEAHQAKLQTLMKAELSWEKMKAPMIVLYEQNYSAEEIKAMLAFYESPVGQSIIAKMPQVAAASMDITQTLMRDTMPKIQALSQEFNQQLMASRKTKQSADETKTESSN